MDAFYEESAVNKNPKSGEKKYKILHIFSIVFLVLAVIFIILFIFIKCFGIKQVRIR